MPNIKLLFIHGYTASSQADWYPAISIELKKYNVDFVIPDLPGGDHPHVDQWLNVLHETVKNNTKPLVIVGHSLGTRTALLYIEKYRVKVEKLFLIAAFANDVANAKRRNEHYADFFQQLIDIENLKPLIGQSYVLHSTDDDAIPYEQGVRISHDLGAELITFFSRNHFSDAENAPIILEILRDKISL